MLSVSSNWLLRWIDGWNRHAGCSSSLLSQFISPQRPLLSLSLSPSFCFSLFISSSSPQITLSVICSSGGGLMLRNWFLTHPERRKRRLTLSSIPPFCLLLAFRLFWFLYCISCLFFFLAFQPLLFSAFFFSGFSLLFIYLSCFTLFECLPTPPSLFLSL